MKYMLENAGCIVSTATNISAAFNILSEKHVDLICSDYHLPGSPEIFNDLLGISASGFLPTLLIYTSDPDIAESAQSIADTVLYKPFFSFSLVETVNNIINSRSNLKKNAFAA
jgi:CheY-like chemotaxis protein